MHTQAACGRVAIRSMMSRRLHAPHLAGVLAVRTASPLDAPVRSTWPASTLLRFSPPAAPFPSAQHFHWCHRPCGSQISVRRFASHSAPGDEEDSPDSPNGPWEELRSFWAEHIVPAFRALFTSRAIGGGVGFIAWSFSFGAFHCGLSAGAMAYGRPGDIYDVLSRAVISGGIAGILLPFLVRYPLADIYLVAIAAGTVSAIAQVGACCFGFWPGYVLSKGHRGHTPPGSASRGP
eukprot:gnl/TRDRNA2_/TRDRNA2_29786_c0_seq1.p1 gnl/TRDRNA2_/TRDRNA2_29786_c0~~gnl/TRDRNA2_/TRDRNA2_29786_c0_seq1.p1  ORF type:complete len:235 (+),score=17.88 gnl/TRDRNA2_/TRDRNA2_29786_c0_seq1:53-757(+)